MLQWLINYHKFLQISQQHFHMSVLYQVQPNVIESDAKLMEDIQIQMKAKARRKAKQRQTVWWRRHNTTSWFVTAIYIECPPFIPGVQLCASIDYLLSACLFKTTLPINHLTVVIPFDLLCHSCGTNLRKMLRIIAWKRCENHKQKLPYNFDLTNISVETKTKKAWVDWNC